MLPLKPGSLPKLIVDISVYGFKSGEYIVRNEGWQLKYTINGLLSIPKYLSSFTLWP
jgi:hypothetical protein